MSSGMQYRGLFIKTAPYKYARHFNLNSVLDGLQGYKIVSGEVNAIDHDSASVFGEIKPREKTKPSENKFWTKQNIKKPKKYNPYARPSEREKSEPYRPDDYEVYYGNDKQEDGTSAVDSNDFFNLNEVQKSVQPNNAFPGYQPYESTDLPIPEYSAPSDDPIPEPSLDHIDATPSGDDADDTDYNLDFYQQLEQLAKGGNKNVLTYAAGQAATPSRNGSNEKVERLKLPEMEAERWNYSSHKYQTRQSSLCTYKCWKCKRVGHLPEDCTAFIGVAAPSPADPTALHTPSGPADVEKGIYTPEQRRMHNKCKKIAKSQGTGKCGDCGARANLAQCLDCGVVVCDNKGHLVAHLRNNPGHRMLYSYKLRRQIKCCKTTCSEMNIYKLHACSECLERCFERHYSMMNATWSGVGLKYLPNAIACDEHFEWHRINCANSRPGYSTLVVDKDHLHGDFYQGQLSEYLF
jgi:hypothetical protein